MRLRVAGDARRRAACGRDVGRTCCVRLRVAGVAKHRGAETRDAYCRASENHQSCGMSCGARLRVASYSRLGNSLETLHSMQVFRSRANINRQGFEMAPSSETIVQSHGKRQKKVLCPEFPIDLPVLLLLSYPEWVPAKREGV